MNKIVTIKDPIHGWIKIRDEFILELISTSAFQRLRSIRQLGFSSHIFPSAEHSRFTHSLGVYQLATKVSQKINLNEKDHNIFIATALLHDIGHGSFSHAFEDAFSFFNHEEQGIRIISDKNQRVYKILEEKQKGLSKEVCAILNGSTKNKILKNLVSGTIDIDRMDYLLRDSYFAGVNYGNYELDRLITGIKVVKGNVCFKESVLSTVEQFLISRKQMFAQLYYHPVAIYFEEIFIRFLKHSKKLYQSGKLDIDMKILYPFFAGNFTTTDFLELHDYVIWSYIKEAKRSSDKVLSKYAVALYERPRVQKYEWSTKEEKEKFISKNKNKELLFEGYAKKKLAYTKDDFLQIIDKQNNIYSILDKSDFVKLLSKTNLVKNRKVIYYL